MTSEIVLMWAAVTLYVGGAVLYAVGTVFRKDLLLRWALWISLGGLLPHTMAIAIRWARTAHGPYLGFYEVVSSYAWASVVVLAILTWRWRKMRYLGVIVMPIAFVMLAAAMFTPSADLEVTGNLASWWLVIHVVFAMLSYSAFVGAFAISAAYLYRGRAGSSLAHDVLERLPRQEVLDELSFRLVAVGFVFLGIMIATGAIWANEAWCRYWGWEPIETWSLISWVIYALYLHLRLTMGWKGRKAAWLAAAALPVILFALLGVPLVYSSIHGAYLTGY